MCMAMHLTHYTIKNTAMWGKGDYHNLMIQ